MYSPLSTIKVLNTLTVTEEKYINWLLANIYLIVKICT